MMWANMAKKFLAAFASMDLESMGEMYDDGVEFYDMGESHTFGKEDTLKANKKVFDETESIAIRVENFCYRDKYISLECLTLTKPLDGPPIVRHEVFIIEFSAFGFIKNCRIY